MIAAWFFKPRFLRWKVGTLALCLAVAFLGPRVYRDRMAGQSPSTLLSESPAKPLGGLISGPRDCKWRTHGNEAVLTLPGGVDMPFVLITPGSFVMGPAPGETSETGRLPARAEIVLDEGFWLGKYEVTQTQWKAVMGNTPSSVEGDTLPVDHVSWEDVQAFIGQINMRQVGTFGLPTETAWEYACRAGTITAFSFGMSLSAHQASFAAESGAPASRPMPVGSFQANAWGLYDMHGNVAEWCADLDRRSSVPSTRAVVAPDSSSRPESGMRAIRGGGWKDRASYGRSWYRDARYQSEGSEALGFRLARCL